MVVALVVRFPSTNYKKLLLATGSALVHRNKHNHTYLQRHLLAMMEGTLFPNNLDHVKPMRNYVLLGMADNLAFQRRRNPCVADIQDTDLLYQNAMSVLYNHHIEPRRRYTVDCQRTMLLRYHSHSSALMCHSDMYSLPRNLVPLGVWQ